MRPNPILDSGTVSFYLPYPDDAVRLDLFDPAGRCVETITSSRYPAGPTRIEWTPPEGLASGLYVLRLSTGRGEKADRKLVVLE
jgi:hypothetical protein